MRSIHTLRKLRSAPRRVTAVGTVTTLLGGLLTTAVVGVGIGVLSPKPAFASAIGDIYTVAGTGEYNYSGDGGAATSAAMRGPDGLGVDGSGDLYIADSSNSRIRKVNHITGAIVSIAGDGTNGFFGDGGPATSAKLGYPATLAVDPAGDVFICDNDRIRKITASTGIITTVAGNGTYGFSGDGGLATSAELNFPFGIAVDSSGNLFFGDNERIRKVTASTGIISTVAGNGTLGFAGDGGAATSAEFNNPDDVIVDSSGNLYISDTGNERIRKVTASTGKISTIVGNGTYGFSGDGGAATSAELNDPYGVAMDSASNLYIADMSNYRIRKITASTGKISTIAGTGTWGFSSDDGLATSAELTDPTGVVLDGAGDVFFSDTNNERVRMISATVNPTFPVAGPKGSPIAPAEIYGGSNPSTDYKPCSSTAYPVECSTGNFWHTFDDLNIPGRGVPLDLQRTYNSLNASHDSLFGYGWSSSYDMGLAYNSGTGTATVSQENGSQVVFTDNGAGSFLAPPRVLATLAHNGDGTWTFTRKKTEKFTFNSSGKLTAETDLNGYTTAVSYPSGSSMVVTDPAGRTLSFTLTSGHITGATDPAGRTLTYGYTSGNLTSVTDVSGGHWQFTYDGSHRMTIMRSPRFYGDTTTSPSPVVTNDYDANGQVDWQTDQLGRKRRLVMTIMAGLLQLPIRSGTSRSSIMSKVN